MKIKNSLIAVSLLASTLTANPSNPTVISGNAEFSALSPSDLQVLLSDKAIINWEEFSILDGEKALFILPSENASSLQRVTGQNLSEIYGVLKSNGTLFLINPNGILIGPDGLIDTAGFLGSTLDIDDAAFIRGQELLLQGTDSGSITHYGTIKASNGSIALIGLKIENRGKLSAPNGQALLGSGERILLKPEGEQRIFIETPVRSKKETGIISGGEVSALQVEVASAGTPYTYAIRHEGKIETLTSKKDDQGRVFLVSNEGKIETSGTIRSPGGEIHLLGDRVIVSSGSEITTSEDSSGGAIFIGYNTRGGSHASGTWIDKGAEISASSRVEGDGGEVRIFGKNVAILRGTIAAEGGPEGGDGGLVEFSTKGYLGFSPQVSTEAARGKTGNLIFDPNDIDITAAPTSPGPLPGTLYTGAGTAHANIDIDDLIDALNSNNVTVMTDSGTEGGHGDINVYTTIPNPPPNWKAPTTLRLEADRDINLYRKITCPGRVELFAKNNINIGDSIILTSPTITPSLVAHAGNDIVFTTLDAKVASLTDIDLYAVNDVKLGNATVLDPEIIETVKIASIKGTVHVHSDQSSFVIESSPCSVETDPPRYAFFFPTARAIERLGVINSQIFYTVAAIEDQVIQLPYCMAYDYAAYPPGYFLGSSDERPFLRHQFVENAAETNPFAY